LFTLPILLAATECEESLTATIRKLTKYRPIADNGYCYCEGCGMCHCWGVMIEEKDGEYVKLSDVIAMLKKKPKLPRMPVPKPTQKMRVKTKIKPRQVKHKKKVTDAMEG
jgi:hypothetical protein